MAKTRSVFNAKSPSHIHIFTDCMGIYCCDIVARFQNRSIFYVCTYVDVLHCSFLRDNSELLWICFSKLSTQLTRYIAITSKICRYLFCSPIPGKLCVALYSCSLINDNFHVGTPASMRSNSFLLHSRNEHRVDSWKHFGKCISKRGSKELFVLDLTRLLNNLSEEMRRIKESF